MKTLICIVILLSVYELNAQSLLTNYPLLIDGGTSSTLGASNTWSVSFGTPNQILGMNPTAGIGSGIEYKSFATSTLGSDFSIDLATAGLITFKLPDADGTTGMTKRGVVSTGTQSFAGAKTFNADLTVSGANLTISGSTKKITIPNGTTSAPSFVFTSVSNTGFSYNSGGGVEAMIGSFSGTEKFEFTSQGRFVVTNVATNAAKLGVNIYKDAYVDEDANGQDGGINVTTYGGTAENPKYHTSTFTGRTTSGTALVPAPTKDDQAMAEFTGKGWCAGCGTDGFETSNRGVFGIYAAVDQTSLNTAAYAGIKTTRYNTAVGSSNHMSLMIDPSGNAGLTYLENGLYSTTPSTGWGGGDDDRFFSIEGTSNGDAGIFIQNSAGSRGVNIWMDYTANTVYFDNVRNNTSAVFQTRLRSTTGTPVIAITTGLFTPDAGTNYYGGTNFGTDASPDNVLTVGSTSQFQMDGVGKIVKYTSTIADGELLIGKTSGSTFEKATLSGSSGITVTNGGGSITLSGFGYSEQFNFGQFNPNDATTYYGGGQVQSSGTTAGVSRVYIPKSGTIKSCYIVFDNSGTLSSNEISTISIRVDNATDFTVSSVVTNDARPTVFSNTSMSVPVTAGQYVEIKWVTPTWTTNPTSVRISGTLYIE